jgi:hypothetical protein
MQIPKIQLLYYSEIKLNLSTKVHLLKLCQLYTVEIKGFEG